MLHFCLIGAGRIGKIHAANIAGHDGASLEYVIDTDRGAAEELAAKHGARALGAVEEALSDAEVGAVVIASSTNTHVDMILAAAAANKAIFCEKPIDLDIERVDACLRRVDEAGVPLFVAFNRRFDPSFRQLYDELRAGAVGKVEMVTITSRDPGPPPMDYVKVSGGLFRDMMIHDLDMARWLLDEEPAELFATASCVVDPGIGKAGDVDTAAVTMKTLRGAIVQISNSRRAVYGYDQRIEVLGEKGMLQAANRTPTTVSRWTEQAVSTDKPLHFFLERYMPAYRAEMDAFIERVETGRAMPCDGDDGRRALVLADAATESAKTGQPIVLIPRGVQA